MFSGLESSALRVSFWACVCGSVGRAWRVFFVVFEGFFCFFFAYSQGNEDLTVWGLILSEVGDYWPFVLQCWGSPLFILRCSSLFDGVDLFGP